MNKVKVGIAGVSRGHLYYELISKQNEAAVVSVMDPDEQALQQFCRGKPVRAFTNYEDMLDSGIDSVVLASPMHVHARQSISALNRGIHVLSEVTACVSMDECRELLRTATQSKAKYMLAENYCYFREHIAIRNMVQAGVFGKIYFAEGEYVDQADAYSLYADPAGLPTWRKTYLLDKRGCTYGTHCLGPLLQWFQERPISVACFGSGNHSILQPAANDSTTITLCQTESGALIKLRTDLLSDRPGYRYFSLQGTDGCYEASKPPNGEHRVWLKNNSRAPAQWIPLSEFYPDYLPAHLVDVPEEAKGLFHFGADFFMVRDFIRCIVEEKPVPIDHYSALYFTIPGLLSEQSIVSGGTPVAIPDIRQWQ